MTLNLVKGEFTELEDALRAQIQKMQERIEKLEKKNLKLRSEVPGLRALVKLQKKTIDLYERDEWRSKYEHTLANSILVPSIDE